MLYTTELH